jgi:uncharacterized protein YcfL
MLHKYGRNKLLGCILLLLFLLVACGSTDNTNNTNSSSANKIVTVTTYQGTPSNLTPPTVVKPKSIRGSSRGPSGSGPIVVTSPQPVPGGSTTSEQIVLKDRTLDINSVSKQSGTNAASTVITLVLTVKNTSNKPIMNQPNFFQLMGLEGDIFSYQSNSSDNFYGTVPANGSRSGTITFRIPAAAAHNLHLLYRPEIASETALILLNI